MPTARKPRKSRKQEATWEWSDSKTTKAQEDVKTPAPFQEVVIRAGEKESEEIAIPAAAIEIPPGLVSRAGGDKFTGRTRPTWSVQEVVPGTSCRIVLTEAATGDLVFRVKAADAAGADDADDAADTEGFE